MLFYNEHDLQVDMLVVQLLLSVSNDHDIYGHVVLKAITYLEVMFDLLLYN